MARDSIRRSLIRASASLLPLLALSCSSVEPQGSPRDPIASQSSAITSADVISRAEQWVAAKLLYCQSANHKPDGDTACPSTCTRTDNAMWDPYRSDCSGLVSWAWGLPAPGRVTGEFAPYDTTVSKEIDPTTLAAGDALNSTPDEHIILFKEWTTMGSEATFIEEPGCSTNPNYAHEFTSKVTIDSSANTIKVAYDGMTYYAIRVDSITQMAPDWAASYVSQSWPLSEASPIQLVQGQMQTGSIDLKNTGGKTWPAGVVKLAPIPRDQASNLMASTWLSSTRVSTISQDVPPGSVGHFEWDLEGSTPGDFQPYFGLVAEGMGWFADSGGPPDNDIQVSVHVTAAPNGAGGSGGDTGAGGSPANGGSGANGGSDANGGSTSSAGAPSNGGSSSDGGTSSSSAGTSSAAAGTGGVANGTGGETSHAGSGGSGTSNAGSPGKQGSGSTSNANAGAAGQGSAAASPTVVSLDDGNGENAGGCSIVSHRDDRFAAFGLAALGALVASRRKRARSALATRIAHTCW